MRLAAGAQYRRVTLETRARSDAGLGTRRHADGPGRRNPARRMSPAPSPKLAAPIGATISTQFALRFEDHGRFGTTLNPKFAGATALGDRLRLRGSWGTSFQSPSRFQLSESIDAGVPERSGHGGRRRARGLSERASSRVGTCQVKTVGDENLRPQHSANTNVGVIVRPFARHAGEHRLLALSLQGPDRLRARSPGDSRQRLPPRWYSQRSARDAQRQRRDLRESGRRSSTSAESRRTVSISRRAPVARRRVRCVQRQRGHHLAAEVRRGWRRRRCVRRRRQPQFRQQLPHDAALARRGRRQLDAGHAVRRREMRYIGSYKNDQSNNGLVEDYMPVDLSYGHTFAGWLGRIGVDADGRHRQPRRSSSSGADAQRRQRQADSATRCWSAAIGPGTTPIRAPICAGGCCGSA